MIEVTFAKTKDIIAKFDDEESYLKWVSTVDVSVRKDISAVRCGYDYVG